MDENMNQYEVIKITLEEFERLQNYMILVTDKNSDLYKAMKNRYTILKVMLSSFGVNIVNCDIINE